MTTIDKKKILEVVTACNEFAINNSDDRFTITIENSGNSRMWISIRDDEKLVRLFGPSDYKYSLLCVEYCDDFLMHRIENAILKIKYYIHKQTKKGVSNGE